MCLLAGLLVMVSALNAKGTDLRPGRNTDLVSLVQSESRRNTLLAQQLTRVREDVDRVSSMAVHRAAGMVMEQLGTSIEDALIRLRAAAYAEGVPVDELSNAVIIGTRRFQEEERA